MAYVGVRTLRILLRCEDGGAKGDLPALRVFSEGIADQSTLMHVAPSGSTSGAVGVGSWKLCHSGMLSILFRLALGYSYSTSSYSRVGLI